ncbi:MAG TPA: UDP-N-acetylmuramoyl-L-alanine--D-glutamate ligase [Planctomycetota bacterium]|nr:UDP-N-acetylmuramoyl-L-alanine--D-glutamate ligase [Planctomycetota bacterium]
MTLRLTPEVPVLQGRKVTVMGLGLFGGGVGVTRFLVRRGAAVTVTDQKPERDLRESVEELRGLPVTLHLGGHEERDFRDADLVIVNPSVPETHPLLGSARALETEMNLFFKLCRGARTVGITGSNGKTTTTTLVGEILKRGPRRVWVGGNIGGSLLESVDEIREGDLVVLELSSFMLENLGVLRRSPQVAVVMNLSPNHLDRHGSMEAYIRAKRQIVEHQGPGDVKILNADDPVVRAFGPASPSRTCLFSLKEEVSSGAWTQGETVVLAMDGVRLSIDVSGRRIPGWFNLQNMAAAATATYAAAGPEWPGWREACETVLGTFPGVEHRLEFVGEKLGVKYYNDSKATDAEATIAALQTLPGPFVLILGGFDKKTPFDALARVVSAGPVRTCILMGQTAPALEAALRAQGRIPELVRVASLEEALRVPARRGETVLLSPACASWDMYRNFTERGRAFKALVSGLPAG